MAKPWKQIRDEKSKLTPAQRQNVDHRVEQAVAALRLVRKARNLTQETLAATMGLTQAEVSKLEHRSDVYVSTMRRYVEAMGGELKVYAIFADGESIPLEIGALADAESEAAIA